MDRPSVRYDLELIVYSVRVQSFHTMLENVDRYMYCLIACTTCMLTNVFALPPGKYEHISTTSLPPLWLAYLGDPSDSGALP